MRSKFLSSCLIALVTFIAFASKANALEWTPTKLILTVEAEKQIADSNLGVRGCLFNLTAPATGLNILMGYFGPTYTKKSGDRALWVSTDLVAISNFFPGRDAFGPSLWVVYNTPHTSTFVESEVYFGSNGRHAYYGFYSTAFKPVPWFYLGAHLEQLDKDLGFGPHAKVSQNALTFGVLYFVEPKTETQHIRLLFSLAFQ